ncbi:MAG: hypothetical protein WC569_01635, partial [Candidatus Omnitrophota bacterium]
ISDKIFKFKFNAAAAAPSKENTEIIFSRIIKMAVATVHLYGFEDFTGMEFADTSQGGEKIYLSRDELENFRKNKKVRLF